jgi:hypothetical protein
VTDRLDEWRVEFDADVVFSNGGGLQAQGFRLDIPGTDIADRELGELFVRHLGLLMVGEVRIASKRLLREPHKGSRGASRGTSPQRRVVELTGCRLRLPPGGGGGAGAAADASARLVDLEAVVVRLLGATTPLVDRPALAPYDVAGRAVLLHTGVGTSAGAAGVAGAAGAQPMSLAVAAAEWLADQGVPVVCTDLPDLGDAATTLLAAGVAALEGAGNIEQLPPDGFRLHVVPLDEGPVPSRVRAYAVVG